MVKYMLKLKFSFKNCFSESNLVLLLPVEDRNSQAIFNHLYIHISSVYYTSVFLSKSHLN